MSQTAVKVTPPLSNFLNLRNSSKSLLVVVKTKAAALSVTGNTEKRLMIKISGKFLQN